MARFWQGLEREGPPELLAAQMTDAVDALEAAVTERQPADVRQAAIDVAGGALDLELQYREPSLVDLARLDLWARQLVTDAAADDPDAVLGDVATLETIWDRAGHSVGSADTQTIGGQLEALGSAAEAEDLEVAADGGGRSSRRWRASPRRGIASGSPLTRAALTDEWADRFDDE